MRVLRPGAVTRVFYGHPRAGIDPRRSVLPVGPSAGRSPRSEVVGDLVGAGVVVGLAGVGVETAVGELADTGAADHHRHRALGVGLLGVERPRRYQVDLARCQRE